MSSGTETPLRNEVVRVIPSRIPIRNKPGRITDRVVFPVCVRFIPARVISRRVSRQRTHIIEPQKVIVLPVILRIRIRLIPTAVPATERGAVGSVRVADRRVFGAEVPDARDERRTVEANGAGGGDRPAGQERTSSNVRHGPGAAVKDVARINLRTRHNRVVPAHIPGAELDAERTRRESNRNQNQESEE